MVEFKEMQIKVVYDKLRHTVVTALFPNRPAQ